MTRSLGILTLVALLAACSAKTGDTPGQEAAGPGTQPAESSSAAPSSGAAAQASGKQEFKALWGPDAPTGGTSIAAATSALTAQQHTALVSAVASMLALPASAPAADKLEQLHQLQLAAAAYDNAQAARGRPRDSKQVLESQLSTPQAKAAYAELLASVYAKPQALPTAPAQK